MMKFITLIIMAICLHHHPSHNYQATGNFFGDTIWVIITVEPAGTMAITQQFQRMDNLGESNQPAPV